MRRPSSFSPSSGLPHRRVEEFKYTDLRALLREVAPFAGVPSSDEAKAALAGAQALAGVEALQVPFVNGHFVREAVDFHNLPDNVEIVPLAEALASGHDWLAKLSPVPWANDNPVYQLNTSFMADGVMIRVAGPVEVPVHLRFVTAASSAVATATRILVVVEEGASVTLLETHESTNGANHQPNDVVEMIAGDRTNVQHVRVNAEGDRALALSTLAAKIGGDAVFNSINVTAGSATSRHQVFTILDGENTILRRSTAPRCSKVCSTATRRWWSSMRLPIARAANCSRPSSTTRRPASSRARSSFRITPRRPTAA